MTTPKLPLDEEATGLRLARTAIAEIDKLKISDKEAHRQIRKLAQGLAVIFQRQQAQQEKEEEKGQPDWLTCRDPDQAREILAETTKWLDECGSYHGVNPVECWPWHPQAVAVLLSVTQHYRGAYSGDATRVVLDLFTQHIPTIRRQVPDIIGTLCNRNCHSIGEGGPSYGYDVTRLDDLAVWWATDRTGLAPGLRPKITATA